MKLPDITINFPTEENIKKILSIVDTEKAILFCGAGFSHGCKNLLGDRPPLANELAIKIAEKGKFEIDEDLSFVSDYYMTYKNKNDLIELLKENFTIKETDEYHKRISSLNWKRIYTTNYDDAIETSSKKTGKTLYSLSVDDSPKEFYKKKNCCIHINGSINTASTDDLDSKFKLTRTSYVSPDSFVNSNWYYYFKKDIEQCSAIIFIGYSLYDIDIEKILFSSPILKQKTYFIIKQKPLHKEIFTLSKYGTVLPIGVDGFGSKIKIKERKEIENNPFWLDAFNKYTLSECEDNISDDNILNFILHGDLSNKYIDNAFTSHQEKPYLIIRNCIEEIETKINSTNFIAIISDFGNGKSITINEAMSALTIRGKKIYYLENQDGDYAKDIEKIHRLGEESILFIDDYSLNIDILVYISKFNSENIKVIFSDRSNNHDRVRKDIIKEGLKFIEIGTDILKDNEIEHFVSIIDNLGYWGEKANLSPKRKAELIKKVNRSQISNILLDLFNSPQIKDRIKKFLLPIINNIHYKNTIFAICLLEIINLPRTSSLISEVAGNDAIYHSELRNNEEFNHLFKVNLDSVTSKSSIFSIKLIQNFFSSSYITDRLLNLAEKYDLLKDNGIIENELFKSLLRFSFAERLLPEKGKLNSLVKYYEELKVRVHWLKFNPHFWLQYGMARMNFGELEKAQANLDEAYVLAKNKDDYRTTYLDTQQARLFILKSFEESDGAIIWDYFLKAHNLLLLLDDDVYKYRQVAMYKRFYEKKFISLSKKNKVNFKDFVLRMKSNLEKSNYYLYGNSFTDYSMDSCYRYLTDILEQL